LLERLVMNDEIIAMTRRIMRGIEVSDDILTRHTPPPLPDRAAEKIAAILWEAEARPGAR
jgi:hypothetical protein